MKEDVGRKVKKERGKEVKIERHKLERRQKKKKVRGCRLSKCYTTNTKREHNNIIKVSIRI